MESNVDQVWVQHRDGCVVCYLVTLKLDATEPDPDETLPPLCDDGMRLFMNALAMHAGKEI